MSQISLDEKGCLVIEGNKKLIEAIIAFWGDQTNICIVLKDDGGGGAPADSMCSCRFGKKDK